MTKATARRIVIKGKTYVEVTLPDGTVHRYGGKIAERAKAVLLASWPTTNGLSVNGLRGDYLKAVSEAASWLVPSKRKTYRLIALEAYAIRIED